MIVTPPRFHVESEIACIEVDSLEFEIFSGVEHFGGAREVKGGGRAGKTVVADRQQDVQLPVQVQVGERHLQQHRALDIMPSFS